MIHAAAFACLTGAATAIGAEVSVDSAQYRVMGGASGSVLVEPGSFPEFEKKVRVLRKRQDEANEAYEKVRQQEKPSEQDVQRMRDLQSKVTEAATDVFDYMSRSRFTDSDRAEMQAIMDRILAETPTKDGKKTASARTATEGGPAGA